MDAREKIADLFASQDEAHKSPFWTGEDQAHAEWLASAAIAIVRDALTSPEALYAATDALNLGFRDVYAREMAGSVVTVALDTAFGEEPRQEEEPPRPKIVAGDKLECHRTYQFDHEEDGVMYFRET